jgi:hypothetical protein
MNCKQGDLAMIVSPDGAPSVGMIVTCVRLVPNDTTMQIKGHWFKALSPTWELDREIPTKHLPSGELLMVKYRSDRTMRPLRWSNEEDEMVTRTKKPTRHPLTSVAD